MDIEEICWAVLVPAPHARVSSIAQDLHGRRYRQFPYATPWTVVAGSGDYSAIVEPEEGSEGSDESVAEEASRMLEQDVYLLRFREEAPVVWVYRGGRRIDALEESPAGVAARLGCPIVTEVPFRGASELFVVEGATEPQVIAALGEAAQEPWCHSMTTPAGDVIIYSEDGDTGGFADEVAAAIPSASVFRVLWGPEPERFGVHLLRGNVTVGILEVGVPDMSPSLSDVRGERTRAGILEKLGIPDNLIS